MTGGPQPIPVEQEPPPMLSGDERWRADRGVGKSKGKGPRAKRGSGRFSVLNTFVDVTLRQLDRTAAVVWLILYRDTKPNGLARTGQADISRRAGVTVRTVYTALRRLEKLGLLLVVHKGGLNRGASIYRLRAVVKSGD